MLKLYCGISRNGIWYNYTEVHQLKGGALALLDTSENVPAARLLSLLKNSVTYFYTESGEEYKLTDRDYLDIELTDAWLIGYQNIKNVTGTEHPVIPEHFMCPRCSRPGDEKYTAVNESWQELIDNGMLPEIYLEEFSDTFEVDLPEPIEIEASRTILGGTFTKMVFRRLTVSDMLKLQRSADAMSSEANQLYSTWDTQIVHIHGIQDRDLNLIKNQPHSFFTKKYITSQQNINAIIDACNDNMVGIDASNRSVMCQHCGYEIGGMVDQTNFFSALLPKKSSRGM